MKYIFISKINLIQEISLKENLLCKTLVEHMTFWLLAVSSVVHYVEFHLCAKFL